MANFAQTVNEPKDLAPLIDHTFLRPEATVGDIRRLCREAKDFGFFGVCVNGDHVSIAARDLVNSNVCVVAVVGFPLGACTTATKAFEAREAIQNGAREIDMVINIGLIKAGQVREAEADIAAVVKCCDLHLVKVILETSLLSREEKILACNISKNAGASFVKTSTGFAGGGATVDDIRLIRQAVGEKMGVKASGGIKSFQDAQKLIAAGASRIGTSSSVSIVQGQIGTGGY